MIAQRPKYQTWACYRCEGLVPDAEIFLVGSQTGEAIVLHRQCVVGLLQTNVSSKLASRTVQRRRARARREGYR